jgi:hypothetical protein
MNDQINPLAFLSQKLYIICDIKLEENMKNNMSPTVIKNKIKALGRDGVFVAADFYGIAGRDAIRKTLSRLEEDNYIKRVMRGVYYKTRYSKLLKEDVIPSPRLVASAIARNNGWTIAPSGIMALNMTGLSTQVPAQLSYVTNGTPKTYHYDNFTIIFKRTSARDLERLYYLRAKIYLERDLLIRLKTEILELAKPLNPKEYALITMRYIRCEKWDNIIETMHAKRATVFRLNQALLQRLVLPENALNVKEELERFDEQQSAC